MSVDLSLIIPNGCRSLRDKEDAKKCFISTIERIVQYFYGRRNFRYVTFFWITITDLTSGIISDGIKRYDMRIIQLPEILKRSTNAKA